MKKKMEKKAVFMGPRQSLEQPQADQKLDCRVHAYFNSGGYNKKNELKRVQTRERWSFWHFPQFDPLFFVSAKLKTYVLRNFDGKSVSMDSQWSSAKISRK
jgi:hypothetical protein